MLYIQYLLTINIWLSCRNFVRMKKNERNPMTWRTIDTAHNEETQIRFMHVTLMKEEKKMKKTTEWMTYLFI